MTVTGHEILALGTLGAVTFWLLRLYFQPMAPCRRCKGTGHNWVTRTFGGGKTGRSGDCGACGGSRKRWVFGARFVHKKAGSARSRDRKG